MILKLEEKMKWSFCPTLPFWTKYTDEEPTTLNFSNMITQCIKTSIAELVQDEHLLLLLLV